MAKHNPENVRVKREYLHWLANACGRSEATVDMAAAAVDRFEAFNRHRSFKSFRREQAVSFKAHLAEQRAATTGRPLSKATIYSILKAVRLFFEWLSREPGYRQAIHISDAAYFNVSDNDARIATASQQRPAPSIEQVHLVLCAMPTETVVQRRDRALIAFILLTGARDSAVITLRLKHVDVAARRVFQDAREVKTKRAKTITSQFFPVRGQAEAIVIEWIRELRRDHLFGPEDPIFPSTLIRQDDEGAFVNDGLRREPWTTTTPVRDIFKRAFESAALPYANPHSMRRTLMRLAYDLKLDARSLKAWSQNLGHESITTSLTSYGALSPDEQAQVMAGINTEPVSADDEELAQIVADFTAKIAGRRRYSDLGHDPKC